jgi:hypothetical protein
MTRTGRIVALTLGISAVGGMLGAAAGALALLLAALLGGEHMKFSELEILQFPATIGAILGAVLTPIAAWMLLRRVPLGRAFLSLSAGTIVGGVVGWFALSGWDEIYGAVTAATLGFVITAFILRYTSAPCESVAKTGAR